MDVMPVGRLLLLCGIKVGLHFDNKNKRACFVLSPIYTTFAPKVRNSMNQNPYGPW